MQKGTIEIIEPQKKTFLIDDKAKEISVCAYCRVSTDKSDQKNSLAAQKRFFKVEFDRHSNWVKKKVFADKGISGTSLNKRDEFNKMIKLALEGQYQLIITKEVSRFSRNVKDILNIVTELHDKGIYIWFLTDEINTEDADYREKLIKAGEQAEAESRKTSRRVKWGQRLQMERGVVFGRKEMYGYNIKRDDEGEQYFEIIEDEAKVVRRVFEMYASGKGSFQIAHILQQEGVKTKTGKKEWDHIAIGRMLKNEKYVGDLTTGKTYTPDCLTHQKKYNRGESALIKLKGHHSESAIIDRKLWDKVQALLKENALDDETKKKHSNRYWCSGKIFCGECGQRFVSHTKKQKSGNIVKSWKCWNNQQRGMKKEITIDTGEKQIVGCDCKGVNDRVLRQGVYDIITQIIKPQFDTIYTAIKTEFENADKSDIESNKKQIEKVQKQIDEVNQTLVNLTLRFADDKIPEAVYNSALATKNKELQALHKEMADLTDTVSDSTALSESTERKLAELQKIINLQDDEINEDLYRNLVEKIEVCKDHILKFYFYALPKPIIMQYTTSGRKETYTAHFKILT